jgi:hypothetical protein
MWEYVSFKQVIQQGSHPDIVAQPYLPWEVFSYFHDGNIFSDRIEILIGFRNQLTSRMVVQRILVEDIDETETNIYEWFENEVRPYGYALESVLGSEFDEDSDTESWVDAEIA